MSLRPSEHPTLTRTPSTARTFHNKMANTEWAPHYIDRPVDHGRDCAHTINRDGTMFQIHVTSIQALSMLTKHLDLEICNCYLSWNKDVITPTSAFQCATSDGPGDEHGKFDEYDRAAIQDFMERKKAQFTEQLEQRSHSSELYQPLIQGEIRVLELHPGKPGAQLDGTLHIVHIDFTHPSQKIDKSKVLYTRGTNHAVSLATEKPLWYTALSYVWGPPVFDQTIQFADKLVKITSGLATALNRLRSDENSHFFWIDQICIDQPNIKEKEQQIPLMGLIYTHATNTVIWLGDEDGQEPGLAFETMEHVYTRLQMSDVEITPNDFARLDFPPAGDRSWRAIQQLLQRPWLFRLWTIQEAVLSRHLFVQCGKGVVCWDDLAVWCYVLQSCNLLQWLETYKVDKYEHTKATSHSLLLPSGGAVINSLQADRLQSLVLQEKEYLLNSLVQTRYAQVTQAKDKIYGVLGITSSNITPDYSPTKSARDVYHEACVTQLPQLIYELLSCVDHDTPMKPSWVPDWNTARVTEALGYSTKALVLYQSGWTPMPESKAFIGRPAKVDLSEDQKRITLSGILFDKVSVLGRVSHKVKLDIDDPRVGNEDWVSNIQLVRDAYDGLIYPTSNISIYDAFWQTLIAGRDGSGTAAPSQDHGDVFSLILDSATGEMPSLPGQSYSPRRQKGFFTLNSLRARKPAKTLEDLRTAFRSAFAMRRFAITQKGYFALVPRGAQEGDVIVVFDKACVPFVIREARNGDAEIQGYELLGEAYVHGIMKGEAMGMVDSKLEDVTLV
jgi:hypothetical protein